jgi:hypothetical protein
MTLPYERTRAVLNARDFLRRMSNVYQPDGIRGLRKEVRQEARDILRHFPHWFDLGRADCWDEGEARLRGNEDEASEPVSPPGWLRPAWMGQPYWVDPPQGWRYGFPKLYDPSKDGPMREWLVKSGYPKALADKGMPCTFTEHTEGDANG